MLAFVAGVAIGKWITGSWTVGVILGAVAGLFFADSRD